MRHYSNGFGPIVLSAAAGAVAVLLVVLIPTVAPRQAAATPQFTQETGLPCGRCHVNAAGGGKLKAFGEKFKANGDKLPSK